MDVRPRVTKFYTTAQGVAPCRKWLDSLDSSVRFRLERRLTRVRLGNLGKCKTVGGGVWELKVDDGPGYRIYFGQDGEEIVVLLCGGDQGGQDRDIALAKDYW